MPRGRHHHKNSTNSSHHGWEGLPLCWWLSTGGFTMGMSKLLRSASGVTSLTSAILASVDWISLHSASPIEWISTPSTANWTTFPGPDLESHKQALSTSSSDKSTCFVIEGVSSAPEHDSDLSSRTCLVLPCCLIRKRNVLFSNF